MTEKEIKEKWFPICQPGNLVKRTDDKGKSIFFVCLAYPSIRKISASHIDALEMQCVEIGRPNKISIINWQLYEYGQDSPRKLLTFENEYTLELSNVDEMIKYYKQLYEKEIREINEHLKEIKKDIQIFKQTRKSLDKIMQERYIYGISCLKKYNT